MSPTNDKAVEEQENDEWTEVHEYLTQSRTKVTRTEEKEANSSDEEERSKTVHKTDSFQLHSKDDSLFLAVSSKSALQEQCDKSEEAGVYSSNTSKIMSEIDIDLEDQSKKSSNAFEGNNHSQGQATSCKTEKKSLGKDGKGSPQNTAPSHTDKDLVIDLTQDCSKLNVIDSIDLTQDCSKLNMIDSEKNNSPERLDISRGKSNLSESEGIEGVVDLTQDCPQEAKNDTENFGHGSWTEDLDIALTPPSPQPPKVSTGAKSIDLTTKTSQNISVCPPSPDMFADSDNEENGECLDSFEQESRQNTSRKRSLSVRGDSPLPKTPLEETVETSRSGAAKKLKFDENFDQEPIANSQRSPSDSRKSGSVLSFAMSSDSGGDLPDPDSPSDADLNNQVSEGPDPVVVTDSPLPNKQKVDHPPPTVKNYNFDISSSSSPSPSSSQNVVSHISSQVHSQRLPSQKPSRSTKTLKRPVSNSPNSTDGESEASITDKCMKIKSKLEEGEDVKSCLRDLWAFGDRVTLDALLKSGVGKPVHKLLTSTDREVKSLSTKLVAKWKGLIAAKDKEKTPPVTPRPDYSKMLSPGRITKN